MQPLLKLSCLIEQPWFVLIKVKNEGYYSALGILFLIFPARHLEFSIPKLQMPICRLCEREVNKTTKHHLVPKQKAEELQNYLQWIRDKPIERLSIRWKKH